MPLFLLDNLLSDIIFGFEDSNLNLLPKSVKIGSHFGDFILNLTMTLKWMNYPKALKRNLLFSHSVIHI